MANLLVQPEIGVQAQNLAADTTPATPADALVDNGYLKNLVGAYHKYMFPKGGKRRGKKKTEVFLAAVLTKESIQKLLGADASDYDGLRIYMVKDDPDQKDQLDVRMLAVPVKNDAGRFLDQLGQNDTVLKFSDCRSPYCQNTFAANTADTDNNLLPENYFD